MRKLRFLILGFVALTVLAGCDNSNVDIEQPLPVPPIARLATYLLNADRTGVVGVYSVDPINGNLSEVPGSPFQADHPLITLAVHPNGRLVFGGVDDQPFLEGFSLDPSSGALTQLPGYPIASLADGSPFFDNSGEFLYVIGETQIDGFRVNADSGALLPLAGFPLVVPGMQNATSHQVSADDRFLYVPDRDTDQVFVFSRNTNTGSMFVLDQIASGGVGPTGAGLTPDGRFLYIAHEDGTVTGFEVEGDGTLTALPGAPTVYAAAPTLSFQLAFVGNVLYLADAAGDTLNAFRISADGSLTQVAGFPVNGGGAGVYAYPFVFADLLYTSDGANNQINAFTVDDDDSVDPVAGSPFDGNGSPTELEAAIVSF